MTKKAFEEQLNQTFARDILSYDHAWTRFEGVVRDKWKIVPYYNKGQLGAFLRKYKPTEFNIMYNRNKTLC